LAVFFRHNILPVSPSVSPCAGVSLTVPLFSPLSRYLSACYV
jgi:hypothetical protein